MPAQAILLPKQQKIVAQGAGDNPKKIKLWLNWDPRFFWMNRVIKFAMLPSFRSNETDEFL